MDREIFVNRGDRVTYYLVLTLHFEFALICCDYELSFCGLPRVSPFLIVTSQPGAVSFIFTLASILSVQLSGYPLLRLVAFLLLLHHSVNSIHRYFTRLKHAQHCPKTAGQRLFRKFKKFNRTPHPVATITLAYCPTRPSSFPTPRSLGHFRPSRSFITRPCRPPQHGQKPEKLDVEFYGQE